MEKLLASGSATNAGIDFQQRVSAWFLAALFLNLDISSTIELADSIKVKEVSFETSAPIDDLKIRCEDGLDIYVQIKRTVQLSTTPSSPFYKTIDQFLKQHLLRANDREVYFLVVSSDASSKVIRELRKILESIRLNDEGFKQNPLNKSERDTYQKYKTVVRRVYKKHTSKEVTPAELKSISQKMYISVFDIEQDMPLEKAVILLLSTEVIVNPSLIWANLIKSSLFFASKRLSINAEGLLRNYKRYLKPREGDYSILASTDDLPRIVIENSSLAASGFEVLLVESFLDGADLVVAELARFDDACSKRLEFFDNKCLLSDKKTTWTILHRCSTLDGMTRFIEDNSDLIVDKRITIAPWRGSENLNLSYCAMAHSELCTRLMERRPPLLKCLHCDKAISEHQSSLVEIDDNQFEHSLGIAHKECIRPIDRVLGVLKSEFFERYNYLKKFDVNLWARCIKGGQGLFNQLRRMKLQGIPIIGWDSEIEYDAYHDYCIRVNLEGGSVVYIYSRGKIERLDKTTAAAKAEEFNNSIRRMKLERNPYCFTSKNRVFGDYNYLLRIKEDDEQYLECINSEPVRYTELLGKTYNLNTDYYAPLCLIIISNTGEMFSINSHVVFITDPLSLQAYLSNWQKAGIQLDPYELRILKNDMEFDNKIKAILKEDWEVIIDPIVDQDKNFVKGYRLKDINEEINRAKELHQS